MVKKFVLALLFFPCASLYAQETDFERMRQGMTDQSLPLVNISYEANELSKEEYTDGEIEIVDKQKRTDEENEYVKYGAQFRIRGSSIADLDKKSFAVKLFYLNDKGKKKDLDVSIFGIRLENSWILDAMGFDRIRMRNRVCYDLWNEMSGTPYDTDYEKRNGTKGVFVEVFINGTYHGLYCMTDKIDRKLLNLKKYDKDEDEFHGLMYQGKKKDKSHLDYYYSDAWELEYPDDYSTDPNAWEPLQALIGFCSENTNDETFHDGYNDYFYKSNLVDYMVMTMALNVTDNLYKNTFLSVPDIATGHRYLLTPWDMDSSLGGNSDGDQNTGISDVTRYNNVAPYDRLYKKNMDDFVIDVKKKWLELQKTVFSIAHVNKVLDDNAALFGAAGAWKREYDKWNGSNSIPLSENLSDELDDVKQKYANNFKNLCDSWGWRGDVNGDKKVDLNDVGLLCDIILGNTTEYEFYKADVNGDDVINAADIVEVISLGLAE